MKTAIAGVILGLLAIPAAMAQSSRSFPVEGQGHTQAQAHHALQLQAQSICGVGLAATVINVQILPPLIQGELYYAQGLAICGNGGPGWSVPVIPGIGLY